MYVERERGGGRDGCCLLWGPLRREITLQTHIDTISTSATTRRRAVQMAPSVTPPTGAQSAAAAVRTKVLACRCFAAPLRAARQRRYSAQRAVHIRPPCHCTEAVRCTCALLALFILPLRPNLRPARFIRLLRCYMCPDTIVPPRSSPHSHSAHLLPSRNYIYRAHHFREQMVNSAMQHVPGRPTVQSLHIIYDADGTITGELVYMLKKMLGIAHCAACDITHGPRKEKPEFTRLKSAWHAPLYNIHRDEMDSRMARATAGRLPCVVARTEQHDVVLVDAPELERCQGDVASFQNVVDHALNNASLRIEPSSSSSSPMLPHDLCFLPATVPDADALARQFAEQHRRKGTRPEHEDAVVPGL